MSEAPLVGIRVLEIAQNVAVPYCGRLLRSLGAEVAKIEPPTGDAMRHLASMPTKTEGAKEGRAYQIVNQGKKSVTLDIASRDAAVALNALVRWADVVLVAVKPKDIERYNIGYDRLKELNPTVIVLDHRPFGREGPLGSQGGYDVLMQSLSGMALATGRPTEGGRFPATVRPAFNDFGTGMLSALGVVAAIRHRDLTGEGQVVGSSLLATALNFMSPLVSQFDHSRERVVQQWASEVERIGPDADFETQREAYESFTTDKGAFLLYFRHYQTADGFVSVGCLSPALFARFHAATGITSPIDVGARPGTPAFYDIIAEAEATFHRRTTDAWMDDFLGQGVPCSRFNLPHEVLDDPQVVANGFRSDIDHPETGGYVSPAFPLSLSESVPEDDTPSPTLGQHTAELLAAAGLTDAEIAPFV